jgi:hypothetical protein
MCVFLNLFHIYKLLLPIGCGLKPAEDGEQKLNQKFSFYYLQAKTRRGWEQKLNQNKLLLPIDEIPLGESH